MSIIPTFDHIGATLCQTVKEIFELYVDDILISKIDHQWVLFFSYTTVIFLWLFDPRVPDSPLKFFV